MELNVYNPFVKTMRSDKGARIEFDLEASDISKAMDFSRESVGMYKITIEPVAGMNGAAGSNGSVNNPA